MKRFGYWLLAVLNAGLLVYGVVMMVLDMSRDHDLLWAMLGAVGAIVLLVLLMLRFERHPAHKT